MDFAVSGPLVRRSRLVPDACPSTRTFAVRFLQTSPRGDSPCVVANPSPPSGWVEDFHLQATEHAQHTTKPLRGRNEPPLRPLLCGQAGAHQGQICICTPIRFALKGRVGAFGGRPVFPKGLRAQAPPPSKWEEAIGCCELIHFLDSLWFLIGAALIMRLGSSGMDKR